MLRAFFDVRRPLGTLAYAAGCAAAYLSQPLYVLAVAQMTGRVAAIDDGMVWVLPIRLLTQMKGLPTPFIVGGMLVCLAAAAILATLSFRRADKDGLDAGVAALAVLPLLQFVAVAWFTVVPLLVKGGGESPTQGPGADWITATQGALAGVGLTVFAVAVSTLAFGAYGFGLFVLSPLLVGFTTGYLVNRRVEAISSGRTVLWVAAATALGSAMLIAFGLEGGVCMVLATPIMILPAMVGGLVGRLFVLGGRNRARPVAMSLALLPIAFAVDAALPPDVVLTTNEVIEIDAPPAAVWQALTDMGEIEPAPSLLFRLGVAYPLRAELRGEGVGAERIGIFSTGVARERITAWIPERRLAFKVLSNPPSMRELSPRAEVNAPHVDGYFDTTWTRFDLQPLSGGGTRLLERAEHHLRLDPAPYWTPLARWAIHANNLRVLRHIRNRAQLMDQVSLK